MNWSLYNVQCQTDLLVKSVWKILSRRKKCHQSCLVVHVLDFCSKLYQNWPCLHPRTVAWSLQDPKGYSQTVFFHGLNFNCRFFLGCTGCICSDGSLDAEINNSVPVRTLSQNLKRMLAEVEELQSHDHHRSMAMLRSELQALQEKVVDEQIFQKSELLRYHTSLSVDVNRSMAMLRSELQELQGKVAIEQTDLKAYLLRNHASLAESLNRNGTTLRSELQELQSKMASELQKLQIKSTSELQTLQSETTSELQKLQSKTTREQTKLKSQLLRDHASLTNDVTEAKSTLTKLKTRFDVSERQRTTNISSLQKVRACTFFFAAVTDAIEEM